MRPDEFLALRFREAARSACRMRHLDPADALCLQMHATAIYLLPHEDTVIRLAESTEENLARARNAVRVTRWLTERGFPATEPVTDQVVQVEGMVATFWRYYPQPQNPKRAPTLVLGALIRDLHQLPDPPFTLPTLDPLARLRRALRQDAERRNPVLAPADRCFLDTRADELNAAYQNMKPWLGVGLIHNDAHCGNLLIDHNSPCGYVLGDWDSVHLGNREIDLLPEGLPGNRYRSNDTDRRAFCKAYGVDLETRPDWPMLRDLRELHALAAYIRMSDIKPAVHAELRIRLESLRTGDRSQRWSPVK